jgi:hypothetical protein
MALAREVAAWLRRAAARGGNTPFRTAARIVAGGAGRHGRVPRVRRRWSAHAGLGVGRRGVARELTRW